MQSAGIPDLLACVNGHFVAIEVKAATGKPSALQQHNISKIKAAKGVGLILYPKDFDSFKKQVKELMEREPV